MQQVLQGGVAPLLQSDAVIIKGRPIIVVAGRIGPQFGNVERRQVEELPGFLLAMADLLFGTLQVVDIGGGTDEFEDVSRCIAQDYSLLELPTICAVVSAD